MFKQLLLLLTIGIVLGGCSVAPQQGAQAVSSGHVTIAQQSSLLSSGDSTPKAGDVAPDFQFTLPDGTTTKLSDLHGKKVLLNFWATWCGPCQAEMPALERAHQQHGSDVTIIGVNKDEDVDTIRTFIKDVPVSFPLVLDPDSVITYGYGVHNLPMSFFINTDGTINEVKLGGMDDDYIAQQLGALK